MLYGPDGGKCLLTLESQEDDNSDALTYLWVLYICLGTGVVTFAVSAIYWLGFRLPIHH